MQTRKSTSAWILLALFALLHCGVVWAMEDERQLAWGINAIVLSPPWSATPSLDELLADRAHTLCLDRFYRDGGQNTPATPTECRIAYDSAALLVVFRCAENNRSMPVSFPEEPKLAAVSDQYMFGNDLLVAPVITEDTSRSIVFPSGVWTSLWDGKTVCGPAELKVSAPWDTIPVYLRPGAVIPVQLNRELAFGASMTPGRVSALVVTPPDGNQTVPLLNDQGQSGQVIVRSRPHANSWKLENLPETSFLLLYGVSSATRVKVDGKVVPQVTVVAFSAMSMGWRAERGGNRLVIRLPPDHPRPNLTTRVIDLGY